VRKLPRGEVLARIADRHTPVRRLRVSADGSSLALERAGGRIEVRELPTGRLLEERAGTLPEAAAAPAPVRAGLLKRLSPWSRIPLRVGPDGRHGVGVGRGVVIWDLTKLGE